ncbi:MAG: alpha/beta hydrolase fold domain-containing protein [Thermoflexaceae bacterium]|nr:alpha/beta hydrolase fold domain-containing protein [Thermoflexaceae bacterium]
MALDPQIAATLATMAQAGLADGLSVFRTMDAPQARAFMEMMRVEAPLDPVASTEDTVVPGPGGGIPVRVYRPENPPAGPLPALVYYHGGGWVIGSIDSADGACRTLCMNSKAVVISVDYRLAPEHKYPAPVEDAYEAFTWVAANAASLGIDPARIAVGGDSAGGNLAAVTALMARDRKGPAICFQMLIYPVTHHSYGTPSIRENGNGYLLTEASMRWFWGHYLTRDLDGMDPYASPLLAPDLSGLPPALVQTAGYDPLRDEGEAYAQRMKEAGVQVECVRYDGLIHGYFGMQARVDAARKAHDDAGAALRAAFATA